MTPPPLLDPAAFTSSNRAPRPPAIARHHSQYISLFLLYSGPSLPSFDPSSFAASPLPSLPLLAYLLLLLATSAVASHVVSTLPTPSAAAAPQAAENYAQAPAAASRVTTGPHLRAAPLSCQPPPCPDHEGSEGRADVDAARSKVHGSGAAHSILVLSEPCQHTSTRRLPPMKLSPYSPSAKLLSSDVGFF